MVSKNDREYKRITSPAWKKVENNKWKHIRTGETISVQKYWGDKSKWDATVSLNGKHKHTIAIGDKDQVIHDAKNYMRKH